MWYYTCRGDVPIILALHVLDGQKALHVLSCYIVLRPWPQKSNWCDFTSKRSYINIIYDYFVFISCTSCVM